jgi:hypothetical protein
MYNLLGGVKLKELAGAFGFVSTIFLFIVNFNALTAKTRVEMELLTTENKIKAKYYSIIGLSFALSFLICDIYLIIKNFSNSEVSWTYIVTLFVVLFIGFLFFIGGTISFISNIFIKHHYKIKINIEDIGEVYIIKMLNENICLCSRDPNIELKGGNGEYIAIKLEDITKREIVVEKIVKPERKISILSKWKHRITKGTIEESKLS